MSSEISLENEKSDRNTVQNSFFPGVTKENGSFHRGKKLTTNQ